MSNLLVPYTLLFGLLTIAGGAVGYVKAKSKASLIAGGISGLLLLLAAYLMTSGHFWAGQILAFVISVLLAGRFIPAFLKTRKPMPAGLMCVLSVIGIILGILSFVA
jgi:uncharacterized membrane protein (UPF0136 family)